MSAVSALTRWDPGATLRCRLAVAAVAEGLERAESDALDVRTVLASPTFWVGAAADAFATVSTQRVDACRQLRTLLCDAADALAAYASAMSAAAVILAAARRAAAPALEVGVDGSVTIAVIAAPTHDAATPSALPSGEGALAATYGYVTRLIDEAVSAACAADARCADELAEVERGLDALLRTAGSDRLAALNRAEMTPQQWLDYLVSVPPSGTDPDAVAEWWASHDASWQQHFVQSVPAEIGNLDGIPPADRDRANRLSLERALLDVEVAVAASAAWLDAHPDDFVAWAERDEHEERREVLAAVRDQLTASDAWVASDAGLERGPEDVAHLLILEPAAYGGRGRAAISVGNVATAAHVAYIVPGMRQWVATGLAPTAAAARRLHSAMRSGTTKVATVAWVGYKAPGVATVPWTSRAVAGGRQLDADLDGLRAVRRAAQPHVTVIGHSYGSTTTGAAVRNGLAADDVVFVGSPGVTVDHAHELGPVAANVWVGAASADPVTYLRQFGEDPANGTFGGRRFQAEARPERNPIADHSRYFDDGSESLANIAHIATGSYADVEVAAPRSYVELPFTRFDPAHDPEEDRTIPEKAEPRR